jgi:hypothetical protein
LPIHQNGASGAEFAPCEILENQFEYIQNLDSNLVRFTPEILFPLAPTNKLRVVYICSLGPFGFLANGRKIMDQGNWRRNSLFSAITFSAKPKTAINLGVAGSGLKINSTEIVIPESEIKVSSIRRISQTALLRRVKFQNNLPVSINDTGPVKRIRDMSAATTSARDSIFLFYPLIL